MTAGQRGYRRALVASSTPLSTGQLLYALELGANQGPWVLPEGLHRTNALLRYSVTEGPTRWSLTGMGYESRWTATDQIPRRAVQAGLIDRFGAVDPSDGGNIGRTALSWDWQRKSNEGEWRANAYVVRSRLDLFSNFTYFLDHPPDDPVANPSGIQGDQFSQSERRVLLGGGLSRRWRTPILDRDGTTSVGLDARQDRLDPVGLYNTEARRRVETVQESRLRESSIGLWIQNDTQWLPWLRAVVGARHDQFAFDVTSSIADNGGRRAAGIASPKASLILGPWAKTEIFLNAGAGFHSNDARGVVARLAPRELSPIDPVTPLVRTRGAEVGLRTEIVPGLQSSLALWQLRVGSELVFSGDAGDTQPSRASRRQGVEWNNHWRVRPWLLLDADLAWSRARFIQDDPAGNFVPGAAGKVASVGLTLVDLGPWVGQFQVRYFGPRPLVEDGSQRSTATTLASLRVGYRLSPQLRLTLDAFNLFDSKVSDIEYFYASRLRGEPLTGAQDIHFHPAEPRSVRVGLTAHF